MQFVNDDMDDELYRRAAEDYHLKTDGADWNKLREKLDDADGNRSGKKKRRGIILLLALVPLLLICTTYINTDRAINELGKLEENTKNEQKSTERNSDPSLEATESKKTTEGNEIV